MRIAQGIITGIGFLGAGMIFNEKSKIKGLTTAAGVWVASGIGIAVGFGLYEISAFVTLLILLTFTTFKHIQDGFENFLRRLKKSK